MFRIVMVMIAYVNSSEHFLALHCILVAIQESRRVITYAHPYFVKADSQICDIFHIYYLSFFFHLLKQLKQLCFSSTFLSKLILKSVIYFIFSTCSFFLLKHL